MVELYLAAVETTPELIVRYRPEFVLINFYHFSQLSLNEQENFMRIIKSEEVKLLVDSGGFTFIMEVQKSNVKRSKEWFDALYEKYLKFLKKWEGYYYRAFELDMDMVMGNDWVINWWNTAYSKGIDLIRVFHRRQGFDILMKYINSPATYLAVPAREYRDIEQLLKLGRWVKSKGKKFHGLAFTPKDNKLLVSECFDSVDSSSWLSGVLYGAFDVFGEVKGELKKIRRGTNFNKFTNRILFNYGMERWVKYQRRIKKQ